MTNRATCILTISCADTTGLVAAIAQFLSNHGAFITESAQYGDPATCRFFMRVAFHYNTATHSLARLHAEFHPIAAHYGMDYGFTSPEAKPKVVILVSKFGHCLNDLLFRMRSGGLHMDVPAIISNHTTHADVAKWHGVPFHHIPATPENKPQAEAAIEQVIAASGADLIVLARYMQVLSPTLSEKYAGRIINIHHSFLPSFKGAEPYSQAHARGVKIIGATAHYVTQELDEGPIIEQRVERVDHNRAVPDLVALGRDLEAITLARAVQAHIQRRVFVNGRKTVVFS